MTGVVFSPTEKDLLYARTDVGGAYRWDATNKQWVPLTDHLGRGEENLTGALSLATDPTDPDKVYVAAGLYTQSWAGTGAILTSSDRGNTWTKTSLPIKLGGNENGRSAGERLQVDPNAGNILYLGSSTDGLWKSTDHAANWSKVNSFPVANSPVGSGGIAFVLFDKGSGVVGSATQTLYAGVLQKGTNLYKSTDGGVTWEAVPGQPTSLMPHQAALAADGTLYLTYADAAGPNGATAGAVKKFNTNTNQWTDISPPTGQGGYAGLSLDAQNPGTILVSTLDRWWPRDEVYRSTDGGETWKALLSAATWDHTLAPYATASSPHWIGDVEIDPFNPDNAWFITGYGVYNSQNLRAADTGKPTQWIFQNKGLEETVPLDLISPPSGAPLLSALGDIDGFKHDNLEVSPAAGRLEPRYGTNTSIDFAEKLPSFMARTYNSAEGKYGAYSINGGITWVPFKSYPAGATGGGKIAVSADGATLVWAPDGLASLYYSRNKGSSWASVTGIGKRGLRPVADRVNAQKFYVYDWDGGKVMLSTDGGASFTQAYTDLSSVPDWQAGAAAVAAVWGLEGELWLTHPAEGLYRSTDSGRSFVRQTKVQEAVKVGFGKAAAGATYPAVFIAGKVGEATGFFRSDDAGATWLQLNDAQHQFGGVNDITGDPRVFGRLYIATSGRGIVYGARVDCNGTADGTAYVDDCNTCVGGTTGRTDCTVTAIAPEKGLKLSYTPNPFKESLNITADFAFEYRVVNILGVQVEAGKSSGTCTLGKKLKPGVYTLVIWAKDRSRSIRIIKY